MKNSCVFKQTSKRSYPSNRLLTLAVAWDETRWRYNYKDGIGQIKPIWHKELKEHNICPNSLQAIEYILVKKGLKHYKGSYNRTIRAYKYISKTKNKEIK